MASRTRNHHVPIDLPDDPVTADQVGQGIIDLVLRAHASGIDADQASREALRALETRIQQAERDAR
ncbi:nucleoside triphosphate pyrophosphohydrolase [Mycobacteroides abscessus subsp. abscessus]|nr:nucleoside triphosphate pyrophosphohydrolase [Mycobacteroides abscessus subsp. abscessus]